MVDFRASLRPLSQAPTPANRGASAVLRPFDGVEEPVLVVDANINSQFVVGETIAVVLGVHFQKPDPRIEGIDAVFFLGVRVIVTWGIGGVGNFLVEADWMNGAILRVPADNLQVKARYVVAAPTKDVEIDCAILPVACLSAGLAYGDGGFSANRLTEPAFLKDAADFTVTFVPNFANRFTVVSDAAVELQGLMVGFGGIRTPFTIAVPLGNTHLNVDDMLPLPNGTEWIELRAMGTEGPIAAQVIFGLTV